MDGGKATALTAHNDCTIWEFDFDRETPSCRAIMPSPADLHPYDGGHRCRDREHCHGTHAERGMKFCVGTLD
ncbi:MAG: hypothetical protein CM15mP84_05140 [Cellvibrionales bacterium]|nr:MAG: hypothetical protein CM15mP84_05140 [Cellvibrionales bacterium]